MGIFSFFKRRKKDNQEELTQTPQVEETIVQQESPAVPEVETSVEKKADVAVREDAENAELKDTEVQPIQENRPEPVEEVISEEIKEKQELDNSLKKTREGVFSRLARVVIGKSKVDDDVLDNLEEALILSDVGPNTTIQIIERIEKRVARDKYLNTNELNKILKEETASLLTENSATDFGSFELPENGDPYVILVVGVNGVGKTTTIGKLANMFKKHGYSVMLGAADTFRAAAVDQLQIWAQRAGVQIVTQGMGADPAAVAFDTVTSAKANNIEVVIIDTAGRLHNKINLMNELAKIKKSIQKVVPSAPQEILLVIDASTGQNAIEQTKQFTEATDVNALAVTKLDGTAKGGVVLGISNDFKIPVKYIGVGEKMDDIQIFDKVQFVDTLFDF